MWNNSKLISGSRLEYLELKGVSLATDVFLNLCKLPSLKTMKLCFSDDLNNYVLDHLAQIKTLPLLPLVGSSRITDTGVKSFVKYRKDHARK
ncbi:hypothetical protein BJV82DRAFT_610086 [Fennellomyces sp. T-0311]|nr:hypothetical protein BJV82DRAFT_610086 [Fennellomyces sp. T-0311]